MLEAGFTVGQVVTILSLLSSALGGIGVIGWYLGVPDAVLLLGLLLPVGARAWFEFSGRKHLPRSWLRAVKEQHTPQPLT